jgi:hypothetical protein
VRLFIVLVRARQAARSANPLHLDELSSEIVRRSSLKHPNIVHFIGSDVAAPKERPLFACSCDL